MRLDEIRIEEQRLEEYLCLRRFIMKELIKKAAGGQDLTREEAAQAIKEILSGTATQAQAAAYLTALSIKGETIDEIVGSCEGMKSQEASITPDKGDYIDFVGTGGDGSNSFNISTTSMFICAAAGVPVAKHGNRASSSKSGASDCLEGLGVNIMLTPEQTLECVNEIGLGFMNAQKFFAAMRFAAPVRKEIGIRTIFNILGPLSNPSNAKRQVIGVFDKDFCNVMAKALLAMGTKNALVVYGMDKMDEVTTTTKTYVNEIKNGKIIEYYIDPSDYDIPYSSKEDLAGGTGEENAQITRDILSGKKGPQRDIAVLNAACGIYIGGKANSIAEGVKLAEKAIDSGKAMEKLNALIEKTNNFGGNE